MSIPSKSFFWVGSFILFSISSFSQKQDLTPDQLLINKLPPIVAPLPTIVSWDNDEHLILGRKKDVDSASVTFIFDPRTAKEMIYNDEKKESPKGQKRVYIKNEGLFFRLDNNLEVQLTKGKERVINPTLSPDSNYVAFTNNNNLYVIDLTTKKQTELTFDGNDSLMNGYASWVYTEEILGRASQYRAFWWSPDSKHIAFFRTDDSPVPMHIITDGGPGQHGIEERERYPKVGDRNPEVRIGIAEVSTAKILWADFKDKDDQYFGRPYWTLDGKALWVQWMNRLQNDLKLYSVDPETGSKKEVYDEKQRTWVQLEDGYERLHFLKNNKNFIVESDKTGWNHLYLYNMSGSLINPITSGKFTVTAISRIDEKNEMIYFMARSRENSARTDFYSIRFSGKDLKRLTFGDYNHRIVLSPSLSYFITTYSNASTPARMDLMTIEGKIVKELGDSKGKEFNRYNLAKTELIRVKSDDGLFDLPAIVTWPLHMDPNRRYPVLINIYGGPNAGTVMDGWSFSANQQWYAREGLIQIAMDHRGSGHFGKEGVNYMYHDLGDWELKDYSTIVRYLIDKGYADAKKICITGFSYGGYLTCLALTKYSDVFTYGMAGGSVTDWTFYDTHYTERYMGTPDNNPAGYRTSSVLNYASKYKGMLQIVHGVIDDNVHVQNSLRLISLLQDDKKDFEFMLYPGGRHGWRGNKGLHFQNLKTKFIYKYLLDKPVPSALLR